MDISWIHNSGWLVLFYNKDTLAFAHEYEERIALNLKLRMAIGHITLAIPWGSEQSECIPNSVFDRLAKVFMALKATWPQKNPRNARKQLTATRIQQMLFENEVDLLCGKLWQPGKAEETQYDLFFSVEIYQGGNRIFLQPQPIAHITLNDSNAYLWLQDASLCAYLCMTVGTTEYITLHGNPGKSQKLTLTRPLTDPDTIDYAEQTMRKAWSDILDLLFPDLPT